MEASAPTLPQVRREREGDAAEEGNGKGVRAMHRSVTMAIVATAALPSDEWAWASPNLWAQQGTGPASQGMVTGPASQGGAATGPGMMGWGSDDGRDR